VAAIAAWIQGRPEPARLDPGTPRSSERALAGIAVIPGPRFLIRFTTVQAEGRARVSLTKGAELVVQGPIGAATFTSGADRLEIENAGSVADFDIQIPEAAPRVEIRVGNVRVLLKDGSRITTAAPHRHHISAEANGATMSTISRTRRAGIAIVSCLAVTQPAGPARPISRPSRGGRDE
jgi:hypothetical protein